jgi:hypothetical protein
MVGIVRMSNSLAGPAVYIAFLEYLLPGQAVCGQVAGELPGSLIDTAETRSEYPSSHSSQSRKLAIIAWSA